jgi:hypothetical protein
MILAQGCFYSALSEQLYHHPTEATIKRKENSYILNDSHALDNQ